MTPEQIEKELDSLENFEQWLKDFSADGRIQVGKARCDCECPLFEFFSSQTSEKVVIQRSGVSIGDRLIPHSRLSHEFICWIDDGRSDWEPVSLAQTKRALRDARRVLKGGAA